MDLTTLCSCLLLTMAHAFNLDTTNFVKYSGAPGSMFGFSVAEHRERGNSWVLIGAPEAQTSQYKVAKGGAVYRCDISGISSCREIPFDVTGNNNNSHGRQIDEKSNQWFGASVRSSGESGIVMACAPRYVWFSTVQVNRRDPVGTCYVARNQFSDFSEYSPCRTRNWGYHRQGSCQAGLGADVAKDGKRLYVGAPGSWYWQGQLYGIPSSFKMPTVSPDYTKTQEIDILELESGKSLNLGNTGNGKGQLFAQNPEKRPEVLATGEGPAQDDDSYMGYSVVSGDFEGTGHGGVAVGMPRGAQLLGKVILYSLNLTNLQNISGEQLGSYFSYSLAVGDIDGDGLDDLIVGAPLYTDLTSNEDKYDTGRVYIYYQKPDVDDDGYLMRFRRFHSIDGKNSKSRFGLSVAGLGDVNRDGYGDFAVGAPYDGKNEKGAVYIFHGSKTGAKLEYTQVIKAEELNIPLSTFGFSVSGGLDLDDNQYPDMVVGAYDSDTAVFFKARPVVKMVEARIKYMSTKQISLDDYQCTLRDLTQVPCVQIEACLKYDGIGVGQTLDVDIGITLDLKHQNSPRIFFLSDEGRNVLNQTMRLYKSKDECKAFEVYIKPGIQDKLTELESELRYSLRETRSTDNLSRSLRSVLDTSVSNIRRDSLFIRNNCGPDNVCIPDLRLSVKPNKKEHLLGSNEKIILDVKVTNAGQDAFEATYNLEIPHGTNYVKFEQPRKEIPVHCNFANDIVKCGVGNPLPQGKTVRFQIVLQPSHREGISRYDLLSSVNSSNPEAGTEADNTHTDRVLITVQTNLDVTGTSTPNEIHYQMKNYSTETITNENEIGPQVYHLYIIRNDGPANVIEAETNIYWPSHTLSGDRLLYLLEQPETNGNIKCDFVESVNDENIKLDLRKKSYFDGQRGEGSEKWVGAGRVKATQEEKRRIAQEDAAGGYRKRVETFSSSSSSSSSAANAGAGLRSEERQSSSSSSSSATGVESKITGSSSSSSSVASVASSSSAAAAGSSGSRQSWNAQSSGSSSVSAGAEAKRTQTGSSSGVGTGKVTYEEGSYRQRAGTSGNNQNSNFQWNKATEEEAERRRQQSQGGYRTRGKIDAETSKSNEELYKLYGANEFRTVSLDVSQGKALSAPSQPTTNTNTRTQTSWGMRTSEEEARRRQYEEDIARRVESAKRAELDADRIRNEEEARRRQYEEETSRRAGSVTRAEQDADRIRYEEELARRAESAEREYDEQLRKYNEEKRKYEEDILRRRVEEERRRQEEESRRSSSSSSWSYEERQRINAEEERRRIAAEAAARSKTYSRQYETNSSWDSSTGGQPRVDTKWSVNDNGVVQSGSSSSTGDEEYHRQLLLQRQRQHLADAGREGTSYRRFQNSSYSRTSHSSSGERVDPDLGYVRPQSDAPNLVDSKLSSRRTSSSVNLINVDRAEKAHGRYRRQQPLIPRFTRATDVNGAPLPGAVNFTNIRCTIGPLTAGQEVYVAIRGRLWVRTLRKIGYHKEVVISSLATSKLTKLPFIGETRDREGKTFEVLTEVMPQDLQIRPEVAPLWIVVLSACAGAIILMLLVALLYACGFFKRNRPSESAEKQPLNRNGYRNGDEAL